MVGLDSNILIRYLTEDDALQSSRAAALIEHRLTDLEPGYISLVVVAETAWVLASVYGYTGAAIADALGRILQVGVLVVQCEKQVYSAVAALRRGEGSFGDALIGALANSAGCTHTLTLDRRALRLPGFVLLD